MNCKAGVTNLLDICLNVKAESNVLLVHSSNTFFKSEVVEEVKKELLRRNCSLDFFIPKDIFSPKDIPAEFFDKAIKADFTIFFDPMGGMLRFIDLPGNGSFCMSFITDNKCLESMFCTVDHNDMVAVMKKFQKEIDSSNSWRITCPAGTYLESPTLTPIASGVTGDGFSLKQFPMGSHRPVLAHKMSGRLAIKWLVSTGVHKIEPFGVELERHVIANIENGKITDFEGEQQDVNKVIDRFKISGNHCANKNEVMQINSWHSGIHPYASYEESASDDYEKWITMAHHNPKMLHFHCCGDFNPGEIAIPIVNPDIYLDGKIFSKNGNFGLQSINKFIASSSGVISEKINQVEVLDNIGV